MSTPAESAYSEADLGNALAQCAAYAEQFGWGSPDVLFALVPTAMLAQEQPGLVDDADNSALSPVVQEIDDDQPLEQVLGTLAWPTAVAGCAVVTEVSIVAPENAASDDPAPENPMPEKTAGPRTARLIAGALRGGATLALLALKPDGTDDHGHLRTHPDIAPELRAALAATLQ